MSDVRKVIISSFDAPIRLMGKTILLWVDEKEQKLCVRCDLPDAPTDEEIAYVRGQVDEIIQHIRKEVPDILGEGKEEIKL